MSVNGCTRQRPSSSINSGAVNVANKVYRSLCHQDSCHYILCKLQGRFSSPFFESLRGTARRWIAGLRSLTLCRGISASHAVPSAHNSAGEEASTTAHGCTGISMTQIGIAAAHCFALGMMIVDVRILVTSQEWNRTARHLRS